MSLRSVDEQKVKDLKKGKWREDGKGRVKREIKGSIQGSSWLLIFGLVPGLPRTVLHLGGGQSAMSPKGLAEQQK